MHNDSWSRQETDHLFDLCRRFDLRFIVIRDRWDRSRFPDRSVEDLKERYYEICATMNMVSIKKLFSIVYCVHKPEFALDPESLESSPHPHTRNVNLM